MIQLIQVELLKLKRTGIYWLVFLVPLLYSAAIIGYFTMRTLPNDNIAIIKLIYTYFFAGWLVLLLPVLTAIITSFSILVEEQAGFFNALLLAKFSRYKLYLTKIIVSCSLIIFSTSISTIIVSYWCYGLTGYLVLPIYLTALILIILTILPMVVIQQWLSFAYDMGVTLIFGACGIILAGLMLTSLGNGIWYFIPYAAPARIVMILGNYITLNPINNISHFTLTEIGAAISIAIIYFIMSLSVSLLWFNNWQGRKTG